LGKSKLIYEKSNGSAGFPGVLRQTPYATEQLGRKIAHFLNNNNNNKQKIILILRTAVTSKFRAFLRGLKTTRHKNFYIVPRFKVAHTRQRTKKRRRV